MEKIKIQIGNKIHMKSGEVGQIINTESPLWFRSFYSEENDGTESIYCQEAFTVYGSTQNSSYEIPSKSRSSVIKTLKTLQ